MTLLSAVPNRSAEAADTTLIEFQIEDQFKHKHSDAEFRGRPLIVVESDRQSSKFADAWTITIRDSLALVARPDNSTVVEVADVRGVPFFIKGKVRGKFPKDESKWVLLDWHGVFARAYEIEKHKVSVLVFDLEGLLQHQAAVTSLNADELVKILQALRGGRATGQSTGEQVAVPASDAVPESPGGNP